LLQLYFISSLEEYLHELGAGDLVGQDPSDEDNPYSQIPNFAHAALILQNSSSVYMRKVDYLHKLVYKALYEFCNNASSSKESSRRKSADSDIECFYEFDPHMEFMLLDDVVPEDLTNRKINLKPDEIDEEELSSSTPNQSGTTSQNRTRLSLGGLSVTKLERSITGGFTSSAQQRALLLTINNGSLRLVGGRCDVGDNGVLLMPGSSMLTPASNDIVMDDSQQPRRSLFGEEGADEITNLSPSNDLGAAVDDDDHSNDGAGFEMNFGDDDDDGMPPPQQDDVIATAFQQQRKRVTFAHAHKATKRTDPWALLDPHSDDNRKQKPLRKGKTIRLPEGVDRLPSECVTGARTREVKQRPRLPQPENDTTTRFLAADTFRSFLRNQVEPPKISFNGLVFKEFTYIGKQKAKERSQERRAQRKKELEAQNQYHPREDGYDDDDDDDDGGGFDFGGGDDDYDDGDNNDAGNAGLTSLDEAFQLSEDSDHGTYAVHLLIVTFIITFDLTNFCFLDASNMGKTFEDLCRAHIQAFAKGAEEFAFNTHLSARVDKWQAKLIPILEEEERRSAFDIHMYSQRLIESAEEGLRRERLKRKSDGSMQAVTKSVYFETVTQHCSQGDVCRMFLASLSLANSGNLKISEGSSTFCFDLLSHTVEHPMDSFKAPSLVEGK
jgi:condensin-2 complex subunit H2